MLRCTPELTAGEELVGGWVGGRVCGGEGEELSTLKRGRETQHLYHRLRGDWSNHANGQYTRRSGVGLEVGERQHYPSASEK